MPCDQVCIWWTTKNYLRSLKLEIMITGIIIIYIGLTILDMYYDFDWKLFSDIILFIPVIIMILYIISGNTHEMMFWFVIFLIETWNYSKSS